MADLKPCPFCGGEAEIWEDKVFRTFVPQCKECTAQHGRYTSRERAVEAWNTRKPMEAVVAEMEEMKENNSGCFGVSCDKCKYNESCLEGEEAFKVALDNAIEVVRNGGKE